jgi:hypothetical protein
MSPRSIKYRMTQQSVIHFFHTIYTLYNVDHNIKKGPLMTKVMNVIFTIVTRIRNLLLRPHLDGRSFLLIPT